ncbi:tetratricopeptide repeat protein [Pirellulaceae bacterium SH449]
MRFPLTAFGFLIALANSTANLLADITAGGGAGASQTAVADAKPNPLAPAIAAFERQDYAEFQRQFAMASVYLPLPADEVFWCRLLAERGAFPQAIQLLETYQKSHPDDPEAYMTFGLIAMKSGRWTDAQLQFEHAESLIQQGKLPGERNSAVVPGLIQLRAEVAVQKQQYELAEQLFTKLQELQPDDLLPTWRCGQVKVMAGKLEEGLEQMKLARTTKTDLPCPQFTAAMTLVQLRPWFTDPEAAKIIERQFRESVRNDRDDPVKWREYLKWLLILDRHDDLLTYLEAAPESVKKTRDAVLLQAITLRAKQDFPLAETMLEDLLATYPDDVEISDQLILVLLQSTDQEKRSRAKAMAEANLERFPDIENMIATAGWAVLCFEEKEKAEQLFSKLVARGALSAQSAYFVGKWFEKEGRDQEARSVFQSAIRTAGIFPERKSIAAKLSPAAEPAEDLGLDK